jgi:hypothetical protein
MILLDFVQFKEEKHVPVYAAYPVHRSLLYQLGRPSPATTATS